MNARSQIAALEEKIKLLEEQLNFYRLTMEQLPAMVYLNELKEPGDMNSLCSIWSNRSAQDFVGYTHEEITTMGFEFLQNTLHPYDLKVTQKLISNLNAHTGNVYSGIIRQKSRTGSEYLWLITRTIILEVHPNGVPRTLLNVSIQLIAPHGSNDQLAAALEEIHRLRTQNQLFSLSKREREILKLIAGGLIDKEIARQLNISFQTAKTHRNNLIHKLNLRNTAGVVAFAKDCGL